MENIKDFFNYEFHFSDTIAISVKALLLVVIVMIVTTFVLKLLRNAITKQLNYSDKAKFSTLFSYSKWIIYLIIMLFTLHSMGVNVTGILAASAAILIGVGLALQTLFQDIISGVFILLDKTLHVGDIIQIDGKIGKVEEIKLRTTRAVTIDNKVLIIPNHLYLTNTLFNWTQNSTLTRENVSISVAYGSDVNLVKTLLLEAVRRQEEVLDHPEPQVIFEDFGESALHFKVIFTLNESFRAMFPKSDIRFEINRLFTENNIKIPFPQREIHIKKN